MGWQLVGIGRLKSLGKVMEFLRQLAKDLGDGRLGFRGQELLNVGGVDFSPEVVIGQICLQKFVKLWREHAVCLFQCIVAFYKSTIGFLGDIGEFKEAQGKLVQQFQVG